MQTEQKKFDAIFQAFARDLKAQKNGAMTDKGWTTTQTDRGGRFSYTFPVPGRYYIVVPDPIKTKGNTLYIFYDVDIATDMKKLDVTSSKYQFED